MIQANTISAVRQLVREARYAGKQIGLVPTMGYLHEGHISLLKAAQAECDFVVVSIFVNPLQFGPNEDFSRYPRDLERDAKMLEENGCDVLFAPSIVEMYPEPMYTHVDVPSLGESLCGASRPGHFRGVATVVSKLLNIVLPDKAYFGQKDGQQVAVIKRMVKDLNFPVDIVTVPIVREPDGLAKSSRNVYLSEDDRVHATVLYRSLVWAEDQIRSGVRDATTILDGMRRMIEAEPGVRVDYVEAVNMQTIKPIQVLDGEIMIAVAAYVGPARLIDNLQLVIDGDKVVE
jgi:pantoate--beta-alanine ligase